MPYLFRLRCGQVDLVDDRHDLMVMLDGLIDIGQRLRLDALRGIYDQQRAFTGREAAAHLIGKVHMAGCIHEVRSEEHTSELHSLMRISYAGFCLTKKKMQN